MTEIRFYHLTSRGVDWDLPEIVQKARDAGHRIVIRTRDADESARISKVLWTWKPESFLPHGTQKDGHAADQPVWLTAGQDNPNGAAVLMLVAGQDDSDFSTYTLCCTIFDGRDEAQLNHARARWKALKGALKDDPHHTLTYWQQGENGWERKSA